MNTSFSAGVKAEVCKTLPQKHCCALAECFGILLYCNSFTPDGIRIITESREFARNLPKLFKRAFDVDFDAYPSLASPGKLQLNAIITEDVYQPLPSKDFGGR